MIQLRPDCGLRRTMNPFQAPERVVEPVVDERHSFWRAVLLGAFAVEGARDAWMLSRNWRLYGLHDLIVVDLVSCGVVAALMFGTYLGNRWAHYVLSIWCVYMMATGYIAIPFAAPGGARSAAMVYFLCLIVVLWLTPVRRFLIAQRRAV